MAAPARARADESREAGGIGERSLHDTIAQFQGGFRQLDQANLDGEATGIGDLSAEAARALARNIDPVHGGLGGRPQVSHPSGYDLMLRVYHRSGEPTLT